MTPINPSSRFHRIIKKLSRCVGPEAVHLSAACQELLHNNKLLGVYKGDSFDEDIVFADQGFLFTDKNGGNVRYVSYASIQMVEYPLPASESIELALQLTDMSVAKIYVVGRRDNYRDVFEVGRFFMRVAEDAGRGVTKTP